VSAARDVPSARPLLDKLGVKPGHRAAVLGFADASFARALEARGANVSNRRRRDCDLVFLACERAQDLARIEDVKRDLARDGALWLIRRKGKDAPIKESQSQAAGLAAGLVDVKVVAFSETHSAEKYVYRLKDR
jgi:hypothetical protein